MCGGNMYKFGWLVDVSMVFYAKYLKDADQVGGCKAGTWGA